MKEEIVQATATAYMKPLPHPPEELETLFRAHYDQVFRTAYRITGSVVDAEDVLQTVFLRLVRREGGHDLSPSPVSYLLRAATNASLDLLRSRSRSKSVSLEEMEPDQFKSSTQNPEAQHASRELRKLVQQAVARLGERAAEIFVLRYYEGYDNREIAEMLGTSQMVVAVTLHRSRLRLRKEIGEYLEKHHA